MARIINTSNSDEISAFLTTTLVSHSYAVESTQSIVTLWDNLRKSVNLKEDLDFVAALLATGRIMDYGFEIKDLDIVNTTIFEINRNMVTRKIESKDLQKELVSALITSASISRSEEVEKTRHIVDLWVQIKDGIALMEDLDIIAGILTTGRIMELKIKMEGFPMINEIFTSIRNELGQHASDKTITLNELTAAFITSAYIETSKKVEKIRDIVDTWLKICDKISVRDQWDYISFLLSTGRIRDMDANVLLGPDNLKNMNEKMRAQVEKLIKE